MPLLIDSFHHSRLSDSIGQKNEMEINHDYEFILHFYAMQTENQGVQLFAKYGSSSKSKHMNIKHSFYLCC
jgi:hypothetical protein